MTTATIPVSVDAVAPAEESFVQRMREVFLQFSKVPSLRMDFVTARGTIAPLVRGTSHVPDTLPLPNGAFVREYTLDEPIHGLLRLVHAETGVVSDLLHTTVQAVLEKLVIEKGEELLLEELSTNWESLEALYEISTDVLRFGAINTALKRLIDRFASLQEGLQVCLFVTRGGRLEPIAASHEMPPTADWSDLGPLEARIRGSRSILINDPTGWAEGSLSHWTRATSAAAAPLTSRLQTVIGALVVWRDDRRVEFDAPFSRFLEAMAYQASMLLESDRLNRTMRENERLAQEIEIASSIQQTLLLGNPPAGLPSVEVASFSAASQKIDGDFHDFLKHDGVLDLLIGDVMGKGVAAALLGAATKIQFLRAIATLSMKSGETPTPVEIVRRAATRLNDQLLAVERFVTLCYLRLDPARGLLEFVDCGHTGILVHRKQTGQTFFLRGDDLPLGVSAKEQCNQHSAPVMPGDTLFLFSDGVTETISAEGELFGDERLIEGVETWSSLGPAVLLKQIQKLTEIFKNGEAQRDDFTCIAVRIDLSGSAQAKDRVSREFPSDVGQLAALHEWLETNGGVMDEMDSARLGIAVTEAFVNCVLHGSDQGAHPVLMALSTFTTHVTVEIRHRGPDYDPLAIPPPSFDGSRDNGFGTYMIMRSADELIYRRDGDINFIAISVMHRQR